MSEQAVLDARATTPAHWDEVQRGIFAAIELRFWRASELRELADTIHRLADERQGVEAAK